jgi:hypothetical protein
MMAKYLPFLLLILMFLHSCTKDETVDIPEVQYLLPAENDQFTYGDTIEIAVDVKSVSPIKNISISIVDEHFSPVFTNYNYSGLNGSTGGRVRFAIIHDKQFIESGGYQVMVRVENEKEQKYKYRAIRILSPMRKLLGAAVITKTPNHINVWHIDQNFQKSLKASMQGDYSGSAYISFHNRMVVSAKVQGSYTMWDYKTGDTILNIQAKPNPPFPYFTGVGIFDNLVSAQYYYAEKFSLFNYAGKIEKTVEAAPGYWIVAVFDVGENFVSIQYEKSSQTKRLVTHLGTTGMNYSYYVLQGPVVAALPFEGKDFMLFSNYNGGGQIELFIWDHNATTRPLTYSGAEFIDAVQIAPKQYYLLTANKVKWFRYQDGSITDFLSIQGVSPIKIRYDELSGNVWIADSQGFSVYDKNGQQVFDQRFNEQVLNIHLIYNY